MKESDMFDSLKEYLESINNEVFSEVLVGSRRADVVAKKEDIFTVIEMKTSLGIPVMEQAYRWKNKADYVYVAIPFKRKKKLSSYAMMCLERDGIGLLLVDADWHDSAYNPPALEVIPAVKQNKCRVKWKDVLVAEHKTALKGGSCGGGYVTPYKITISRIKEYMTSVGDWVSSTDIASNVKTHYRQPQNSIRQSLVSYEYDWCETKMIKNKLYFRIKEKIK
ncbi:MAG: hypothetical protein RR420_01250 [Anaerovoracaceae bacterium]